MRDEVNNKAAKSPGRTQALVELFEGRVITARELVDGICKISEPNEKIETLMMFASKPEFAQLIFESASRLQNELGRHAEFGKCMLVAARAFPMGVFYHIHGDFINSDIASEMLLAAVEMSPCTALMWASSYMDNPRAREILLKALRLEFANRGDKVLMLLRELRHPRLLAECEALCREWRQASKITADTNDAAMGAVA